MQTYNPKKFTRLQYAEHDRVINALIEERRKAPRKHWPDCATNHGHKECDMGPDCGQDGAAQCKCGVGIPHSNRECVDVGARAL